MAVGFLLRICCDIYIYMCICDISSAFVLVCFGIVAICSEFEIFARHLVICIWFEMVWCGFGILARRFL